MSGTGDEQDRAPQAVPGDAGAVASASAVSEHDLHEAGLTDEAEQEGLS